MTLWYPRSSGEVSVSKSIYEMQRIKETFLSPVSDRFSVDHIRENITITIFWEFTMCLAALWDMNFPI